MLRNNKECVNSYRCKNYNPENELCINGNAPHDFLRKPNCFEKIKRPSIKFYLSKSLIWLGASECPNYNKTCEGCYDSADEFGRFPCTDTRGWLNDGTRCQYFEKKPHLISRVSRGLVKLIQEIGGIPPEER